MPLMSAGAGTVFVTRLAGLLALTTRSTGLPPAIVSLTANWPLPRYTACSLPAGVFAGIGDGLVCHDCGADDRRIEGIADVQQGEGDVAGEAELRRIAEWALPSPRAADDQGLVAIHGDGQRLDGPGDVQLVGHRHAGGLAVLTTSTLPLPLCVLAPVEVLPAT